MTYPSLSPQTDTLITQVARFTLEHKRGITPTTGQAIQGITRALDDDDRLQDLLGLPRADSVTTDDVLAALHLIDAQRWHYDRDERDLIETLKDRGMTWAELGTQFGRSAQAQQQRYKRLGGTKTWPSPPPRRGTGPQARTTIGPAK